MTKKISELPGRKDGGNAFPYQTPVDAAGAIPPGHYYPELGMSLRDYFAATALQGLIAANTLTSIEAATVWAYSYADEMLKRRAE